MLSLLFGSCLSLNGYCPSDPLVPNFPSGRQLKYVHLLFDPGLYTPKTRILSKELSGRWTCNDYGDDSFVARAAPSIQYRYYNQIIDPTYAEYGINCRFDDLTTEGKVHANKLGKISREYLVDKIKFIPEKLKPKYFRFFAAPDEGSMSGAKQFIDGFYPPLDDNEVVNLETSSEQNSSLVLEEEICIDYKKYREEYIKSDKYAKFYEEAKKVVGPAFTSIGLEATPENITHGCTWALSMTCNEGTRLPVAFDYAVMEKCKEVVKFETIDMYKYNETKKGLAASPIINHLFHYFDVGIGERKKGWASIEAVRNNVISALAAFLGWDTLVPLGSLMSIEVWEDKNYELSPPQQFIRFVLNGKEIYEEKYDRFRSKADLLVSGYCSTQNVYDY